jgi:transposase
MRSGAHRGRASSVWVAYGLTAVSRLDQRGTEGPRRSLRSWWEPGLSSIAVIDRVAYAERPARDRDRRSGRDLHRGRIRAPAGERQIDGCVRERRRLGADHRYVPPLMSAPGIAWVLSYTIGAEIGDINRFASPKKLCGDTVPCPRASTNPAPPTIAARSPRTARSSCAGR